MAYSDDFIDTMNEDLLLLEASVNSLKEKMWDIEEDIKKIKEHLEVHNE